MTFVRKIEKFGFFAWISTFVHVFHSVLFSFQNPFNWYFDKLLFKILSKLEIVDTTIRSSLLKKIRLNYRIKHGLNKGSVSVSCSCVTRLALDTYHSKRMNFQLINSFWTRRIWLIKVSLLIPLKLHIYYLWLKEKYPVDIFW